MRERTHCPSCGTLSSRPFYTVEKIPGHSCLLMNSRQEALDYPKGILCLVFCDECGFIFNAAFDPDLHNYSPAYEETQGYSPTFSGWARDLAQTVVEEHALHGKTALEIGCGKGEFLIELCRAGIRNGIGIDPAYIPQRNAAEREKNIRFIQDFYGPKYADLQADFICCRHTLEHISNTGEFVANLRECLDQNRRQLLFFEVPDVYRVLKEGAFWDLYYEHCSYFSCGSQARLFRRNRFDVTQVRLDYNDQYVLQMARPTTGSSTARLDIENDLDQLRHAVERFPKVVRGRVREWRDLILRRSERGDRVVVWGGGSKGVSLLTTTKVGNAIEYVVDINPHKHGKFMPGTGQEVVPPEFLTEYRPDLVIVMNPIYSKEIAATLADLGLQPELRAV